MKAIILLVLLSSAASLSYQQQLVTFDYCSLSHSAHVLDRVDQEVLPIFSKYHVSMRYQCPFSKDQLLPLREQIVIFQQRRIPQGKHECGKCKKNFKNADFLEYHMKTKHYRESQNRDVCLSDFCDFFDCPDQPEKTLRTQVFLSRDQNYEGRPVNSPFQSYEDRNFTKRPSFFTPPKRVYTLNEVPPRYHIVSQLSKTARYRLEQQCANLFMSCIDFDLTANSDAAGAFDLLYLLYCQKFVDGVDYDQEQINIRPGQGLNSIIQEVEEWNLNQDNSFRHADRTRQNDIWSVLKIIFGIFAVVLAVLYYTAVYFTLFDTETKRTIINANGAGGIKKSKTTTSSPGSQTFKEVVNNRKIR